MNTDVADPAIRQLLSHIADCLEAIVIRMRGTIKKSDLAAELTNLLAELRGQNDNGLAIDHGTFSVHYKGKTCYLGNSFAFRLIERLNMNPGIFIHLDTLKQDVWGTKNINDEALQKQASILRCKLKSSGIEDVMIDGSQHLHYRLILQ